MVVYNKNPICVNRCDGDILLSTLARSERNQNTSVSIEVQEYCYQVCNIQAYELIGISYSTQKCTFTGMRL